MNMIWPSSKANFALLLQILSKIFRHSAGSFGRWTRAPPAFTSCRMLTRVTLAGLARTALALLSLAGAGCVTRVTTSAERSASLSPFVREKIAAEPIRDYLLKRSAFLLAGKRLTITSSRTTAGFGRSFRIKSTSLRCGTAAAIDPRGYFLTASHNVEGDAPYLAFYRDGRMQFESCRVVWQGNFKKGQPDLAILRIPTRLEFTFAWAPEMQAGSTALAAGLDAGKGTMFKLVCFAGPLLRLSERTSPAPAHTVVYHHAPIHSGDSGGPLVSLDGRLVGVNIEIRPGIPFGLSPQTSVAHRPDLAWLRQVIDADFAQNPQIQEPSPPPTDLKRGKKRRTKQITVAASGSLSL